MESHRHHRYSHSHHEHTREGTPLHVNPVDVASSLEEIKGVITIHNLHI